MTVIVKLFARARDLAGADRIEVHLPTGATVAQLRRQLGQDWPVLAELVGRCAVAVDAEFARDSDPLHEQAEIALLPPVSGG
jgi:molybdopterin converting factor subunit 1